MTKEQYEEYTKLDDKLKGVRDFCFWCGNRHHDKYVSTFYFNIITKGKELFLHRKCSTSLEENNTYQIPMDLQERIIQVVESYLDEKEQELLNI